MSTAAFHTPQSLRHFFADAGKAVRRYAVALFAAQERQFVAQQAPAKATPSERERARTHLKLIRMANDYQQLQPSLAAELRHLAARG
jgi:hypothetical protein